MYNIIALPPPGKYCIEYRHTSSIITSFVINLFLLANIIDILISSDNSRFEDRSSFDDNSSFEDIVSSKGSSKQLLKWYDDTTGEDNPEFICFSKS
ncbi:hypothetical protein Tco_0869876 [Tanacetum coccineum]